ncbi:hypothetical protein [Arthrobacter sp. HLT1-21]
MEQEALVMEKNPRMEAITIAPGPRHRTNSVMVDTADVVRELNDLLTARIVAGMAGIKDPGQARKWANGTIPVPPPAQERLRFAYELLKQIESAPPFRRRVRLQSPRILVAQQINKSGWSYLCFPEEGKYGPIANE